MRDKAQRIALLILIACTTLLADVVQRHSGPLRDRLLALGGKQGYTAPVEVNGADGTITVIGFDEAPEALLKRLGGTVDLASSGITQVVENGKRKNLLVTPTGKGGTAIFLFSTSETERQRTPAQPPRKDMPHYAQSTIKLSIVNKRDNAALCVSEISGVGPDTVRYALDSQLVDDGWSPGVPNTSPSLGIFFRGDETCLVFASGGAPPEPTRITVLHKAPAVE